MNAYFFLVFPVRDLFPIPSIHSAHKAVVGYHNHYVIKLFNDIKVFP